ncbi:RNA polymerase sigma factor [Peptococcaceae bacterium 1198_IL3148]
MEQKIIAQVKKGDQKSFKLLYELYADYALRTVYSITKNKYDAADIVQETFIKVYKNIDTFDEGKPFRPWFYKILINECNRYLSWKNKNGISCDNVEEHINNAVNPFNERNRYDDLYQALSGLDDIYRLPIILKYLSDLSEKDVAQTLNLNINTLKSRLFKGRQRLKELLRREANA